MTHRYLSGIVLTPMSHVHMTLCFPTITLQGSRNPIQSSPLGYIAQSSLVIVCPPFLYKHGLCVTSSLVYITVGIVLYSLDLISQNFLWTPVPPYCQGTCENSFTAQLIFLNSCLGGLCCPPLFPPHSIDCISVWHIEPRDRWLPSLIFGVCVCQALCIKSDAWPAWGIQSRPDIGYLAVGLMSTSLWRQE